MTAILEQLLAMESEAQEAMKDIEKETASLSQTTLDNLTAKVTAIENEGAEKIKLLVSELESHTAEQITGVQEEYRIKGEGFEQEFRSHKKTLCERIFFDIVYGEPRGEPSL
ncbi:MAG: hypothetical protein FWG87_13635 [Defluviitaleaceae bacterium]|nr:hypothetical protein [Defluviitaleaceae bacterium]